MLDIKDILKNKIIDIDRQKKDTQDFKSVFFDIISSTTGLSDDCIKKIYKENNRLVVITNNKAYSHILIHYKDSLIEKINSKGIMITDITFI